MDKVHAALSNIERFEKVAQELVSVYRKKNHDYGNSFQNMFAKYGLVYPKIHLEEKMNRIDVLTDNMNEVEGESLVDSLIDIANYAIMTVMELDRSSYNEEK